MTSKTTLSKSVSKFAAIATTFGLLVAGIVVPTSAASAVTTPTSVGPSTATLGAVVSSSTTLNSVLSSANDLVITGFQATDRVRVVVTANGGGTVQLTSTSNLSAITDYDLNTSAQAAVGFSATTTNANLALATLIYNAGASAGQASLSVVVSYADTDGIAYNDANGHYYRFVSDLVTWEAARSAAAATTFNGLQGYLATSTTQAENTFIAGKVGTAAAWLGGADGITGGTDLQWRWVTGPEAGKRFFDQNSSGGGGSNYTQDGFNYSNFGGSEPNGNVNNNENALQIVLGGTGTWNDLKQADGTLGYVVEYGGMANEALTYASASRTITVNVFATTPISESPSGACVQNVSVATNVVTRQVQSSGKSYCLVEFKNAGNSTQWQAPTGVTAIDLLVVGGGGGGGTYGGGGAGEFVEKLAKPVTAGEYYLVTTGAGGAGGIKDVGAGGIGATSSFDSVTAGGGGGGGTLVGSTPRTTFAASQGATGASSGGSVAGDSVVSVSGIASLDDSDASSFGSAGGAGYRYVSGGNGYAAGGGGGAGGVGGPGRNSKSKIYGGNGGLGKTSVVTGLAYAGGGAGGANVAENTSVTLGAQGTAVSGGGAIGAAGAANTGGGGGATASTGLSGLAGGSGVVAVRYEIPAVPTFTTQPNGANIGDGRTHSMTALAVKTDAGTLTYQWQVLEVGGTWTNVASATTTSLTSAALAVANSGIKYRVVATNTLNGLTSVAISNEATVSILNEVPVNVAFTELNFNHTTANTNYVNLKRLTTTMVGTLTTGTVTSNDEVSGTVTLTGKTVGDRVLFKNVTTRDGRTIDAIVTTYKTNGATITKYEDGANAGGAGSYFQSDAAINVNNGYVEYKFDFYETSSTIVASCNAAVSCGAEVKVLLENVNVSAIDIDSDQWNDLSSLNSFTVSNPTNLNYCAFTTGVLLTSCSANSVPGTYPGNVRFQGPSTNGANRPQDMAIANYASVFTFSVKFGRETPSDINYFGVAFKALSWGSAVPKTFGDPAALFSLTYNGNASTAGVVPATKTGAVGEQFTISTNSGSLAKTGYTFAGWNSSADGTGTSYTAGSAILMPKDGLTLYAIWTPSQVTLTYNPNTGIGAPANAIANAGAAVTLSAQQPTRAGYTFLGWNTLVGGTGDNFASGASFTMPGVNTTLYAKWSTAIGTIAYDANSASAGTEPSSVDDTSGVITTVSTNSGSLERTGFTFGGWNTAVDGSGTDYAIGASVTFPADGQTLTLFAKWIAAPYSLAYNSNGGSAAPASVSKLAGTVFALPASNLSPTRAGYTFAGWNTLANGNGDTTSAGVNFTMPAANTTLYAKWTALPYSVTYQINAPADSTSSGTKTDASTYTLGQSVTIGDKGTFDVETYRFVGWNTLATGLGTDYVAAQTLSMPLNGITLYAKWVLATIKLTYNANGGNGAPAAETRVATTEITLPSDLPTKTGFNFAGWCADLSSCATPLERGGDYTVPSVDTVLYAKWTAIDYTLSYNANGGSGAPNAATSNVGLDVVVSATVPTRTGYTFLGWNTLIGGTGTDYAAGNNFRMGATNSVLYAKWQGDPFTLTYNSNGGSTLNPSSEGRSAGSVANISSSAPVKTGATFLGWNTNLGGTGNGFAAGSSLTMPGNNVTLFAQWSTLSNTVTYNNNGGNGAPSPTTAEFGTSVTVSSVLPTRPGFRFLGWNTVANGTGSGYSANNTFLMPENAVNLYAQWASSNYTLSYDANGGAGEPGSSSIAYDPTATANATVSVTVPTRTGYDFLSWNTTVSGNGTVRVGSSTFAMPAADVTLYAQWSVSTYTVYYNANGGVASIAPQPGRYNTSINLSGTVPVRTGYAFGGWNTEADGTGVTTYASGVAFTIPASNTTLYAKWTANLYNITFDANGGLVASLPSAVTGKILSERVTLASDLPTFASHNFTGWNTLADGSGTSYARGTVLIMPAANVTLYAQWALDTFNVSYNANGGTGELADQTTDSNGDVVTHTATPTRPGFTFLRWDTAAAGAGTSVAPNTTYTPGAHSVLYAIWQAATITVTYNVNGGTGVAPLSQSGLYGGAPIELAGFEGFEKELSTFMSWNTAADGSGTSYAAGDPRFELPLASLTLFAIWSAPYFAVEYDANGGSNEPGDQYAAATEAVLIAGVAPTKAEYEFDSWTDLRTGSTYAAGAIITMPNANVNLVANYIRRASVPGGTFTLDEPTIDPTTGGGKSTASGTKVTTITPTVTNAASQCLEDPIDGQCKAVVVIKGKGTWTLTNGVAKFVPVKGFVGKSIVVHRVTSKAGLIAKANLEAIYTKRPPVTITIGNFIDGSPRITALIGSKIRAFIKRYADYRTIECIGFTEGPTVLKTDKWLSTKRATNACGYVRTTLKKKFVQLKIKASQGTVEASENRRITITLRD